MRTTTSLVELLSTLVNIPSETGHEAAIADWLLARLRRLGSGEILTSGHAVVWRGPAKNRPLLVLAGHTDTVPAQDNGTARVDGDRLYGLGSSDMKGGDAVMLALLESIDPGKLRFDLAAVFYDAEEGPADRNGLGRVIAEMPWLRDARLAVLLEPTDLNVELGCNGIINAEVRVRGKAAHSARPWTGVNAVEKAAPWLQSITKFEPKPITFAGAEFIETLQVTTLKSGRARNVVPDELVANLNYRVPPDRTLDDAEKTLRALVPSDFEVQIVDKAPPGKSCGDDAEVQRFIQGFGSKVAGKQGWTDVARFTAAGVPAFNFGPGIPELAHQAAEYCPIPNLDAATQMLSRFLGDDAS